MEKSFKKIGKTVTAKPKIFFEVIIRLQTTTNRKTALLGGFF
jgi:hypothetical protein